MKLTMSSGSHTRRLSNPVAGLRRQPDVRRVAAGLQSRGIDSRFWLSMGTVGSLDDRGQFIAQGDAAYINGRPLSVAVEDDGIIADVRLEPTGETISARFHGVSIGQMGSILFPLYPGDEVIVGIPDGDLNSPGISILAVAGNARAPVPTTWANDRVLMQLHTALEISAPGIRISSGNLVLNGRRVTPGPEAI